MIQTEQPLRIAVCDDMAADRQSLHTMIAAYLDENDLLAAIDEFPSAESFLAADPDTYALAFLDIYMDGMSGMDAAKRLTEQRKKTKLVFCSTSGEFAAESYDVAALHYFIKPAEKTKIFRVLDRFFSERFQKRTLTVKVGRQTETILLSDILYVEADNKRSNIITKHGIITASETFSSLCERLTPPEFVKPIRYALVSLQEVVAVPTDVLKLSNGDEVPVSRGERARIKEQFAEYKWKTSALRR